MEEKTVSIVLILILKFSYLLPTKCGIKSKDFPDKPKKREIMPIKRHIKLNTQLRYLAFLGYTG